MIESLLDTVAEKALSSFSRREAFGAEGFTDFFTNTSAHQFCNCEIYLSKAELNSSIEVFFAQVNAL